MRELPPIFQHAPEEFFAPGAACEVAWAIRRDEPTRVGQLLAEHPELDLNQPAGRGLTLLFWAYAHRRFGCLRPLVEHGADPSSRLVLLDSLGGTTATHLVNLAVLDPDDEALTAVLLLGANASSKDQHGLPALHGTILTGKHDRMQQLLRHGADPDATDRAGVTAITLLARLDRFEQVYYLLQLGANFRKPADEVARLTQESDTGDEASTAWQVKVKQKLVARGVSFPVPRPGADRFAHQQALWEQTLAGRDWRNQLRERGAAPEMVGQAWTELADQASAARQAWLQQQGLAEPPME